MFSFFATSLVQPRECGKFASLLSESCAIEHSMQMCLRGDVEKICANCFNQDCLSFTGFEFWMTTLPLFRKCGLVYEVRLQDLLFLHERMFSSDVLSES